MSARPSLLTKKVRSRWPAAIRRKKAAAVLWSATFEPGAGRACTTSRHDDEKASTASGEQALATVRPSAQHCKAASVPGERRRAPLASSLPSGATCSCSGRPQPNPRRAAS